MFSLQLCEQVERLARVLSMTLHYKDRGTHGHCDRVALLAEDFAGYLGFDGDHRRSIKLAAAFHDLGKIGVPDQIIHKQQRLTDDEMVQMRTHPLISERILAQIDHPACAAMGRWARSHHECIDGSGYPDGLAGGQIPVESQLLALVDNYDAMAERRPYSAPRTHTAILAIMESETGRKHDAGLFARFRTYIDQSPYRQPF